jgi:hypothetical protein
MLLLLRYLHACYYCEIETLLGRQVGYYYLVLKVVKRKVGR